jgi:tetratricopeptide (TPR) repeat protein
MPGIDVRRFIISVAALLFVAAGCGTTPEPPPPPEDETADPLATRLEVLREHLAANPDDAEAWYEFGNVWFDLFEYDRAAQAYRQATELAPGHARAWCNFGLCMRRLGDTRAALEAYERALALEPDDPVTLKNYAVALRAAGRRDDATTALRRLVAIEPQNALALADLAHHVLEQGRFAEARDLYKRVLYLHPEYTDAYYFLGEAYRGLDEPNQALTTWLTGLARDPSHPRIRAALPEAYWRRGDYDAAWEAVRECERLGLVLDPAFVERLRQDSGRAGPG